MSRARTLAGAIGSDGVLNVGDVAGLAAVASSGSASDLSTGTLPNARLATGAAVANLGYTPLNKAGDTMSGRLIVSVDTGRQATLAQWGDASGADGGQSMIGGNAYVDKSSGAFKYSNSHGSIGATGIRFNSPSWNQGSLFTSGTSVSTQDQTFSPIDALRWDTSGNVTLPVGNLVLASGKGIDFSAGSNASGMTSEVLDDYETGTFTLTIYDSASGSATMTNNTCKYTKIGNLVFFTGTLVWSSTSGLAAGSRLQLRGLPFLSANSPSDYRSAVNFGSGNNAFTITRPQIAFGIDPGNSFIWGTLISGNNQDGGMDKSHINSSGTLYGITGTYQTN